MRRYKNISVFEAQRSMQMSIKKDWTVNYNGAYSFELTNERGALMMSFDEKTNVLKINKSLID